MEVKQSQQQEAHDGRKQEVMKGKVEGNKTGSGDDWWERKTNNVTGLDREKKKSKYPVSVLFLHCAVDTETSHSASQWITELTWMKWHTVCYSTLHNKQQFSIMSAIQDIKDQIPWSHFKFHEVFKRNQKCEEKHTQSSLQSLDKQRLSEEQISNMSFCRYQNKLLSASKCNSSPSTIPRQLCGLVEHVLHM